MADDRTLNGIGPNVTLGKGGPRIKDNAGVVQARNNADTALARVQVATPTANDDAVTKSYADASGKSVDLYDNTGGSAIGGFSTFAPVAMTTARQIDSPTPFTYSAGNAHFTWTGASGTKVLVKGRFTATDTTTQQLRGRLALNSGGTGFGAIAGTLCAGELVNGRELTLQTFAILTLNNGDQVRLEGQGNALGTPTLVAGSSGLEAVVL